MSANTGTIKSNRRESTQIRRKNNNSTMATTEAPKMAAEPDECRLLSEEGFVP